MAGKQKGKGKRSGREGEIRIRRGEKTGQRGEGN